MIDKLTIHRFRKYQESFRKAVDESPATCTLIFQDLTSAGGFTDFVGSSKRDPVRKEVKCLYRRNIGDRERNKFGFTTDISGVVYVPPSQLESVGIETSEGKRFKTQDVTVELHGDLMVTKAVIYRAPYYGSFIAVEIRLADATEA